MIFGILVFTYWASASTQAVCTLPELSTITEQISANLIKCPALVPIGTDPHNAEVTPTMIRRLTGANYLIGIGLGLEDAWLKKLIEKSGSQIKWNSENHIQIGKNLNPRSNDPHVILSPKRVELIYRELGARLAQRGCNTCIATSVKLSEDLASRIRSWSERLAEAGPKKVASYHGAFDSFLEDFNIASTLKIESNEGAPTLRQLYQISKRIKSESITTLLLEPSAPKGVGEKLKELNPSLRIIYLPTGLTEKEVPDLFQLFDLYVSRLTSR